MLKWFFLLLLSLKSLTASWMDEAAEKELSFFSKCGVSKELLETTWFHCKKYKEFKRFKIINGAVYGDECPLKNLLNALVQQYQVPDVDFIHYNEDRLKPSFFKRSSFKKCAPIFVSAKNKSIKKAVLFSDWMYNIADHERGWNHLMTLVEGYANNSWNDRIEKLFWRGTPWDGKHFGMYTFDNWKTLPRGRLVHESQKHPDLIDAAFCKYPDLCVSESLAKCEEILGKIRFAPWAEVLSYKYQIAMDGVTCSFPATQWKLLSGALVFKQESPDIMYFYGELLPWKHYIPVKNDLSDLHEKLSWAKNHDEKAREIAENGRAFVRENLKPEDILEYCHKVLVKYAQLQHFSPSL